jgi:hypothetical protein
MGSGGISALIVAVALLPGCSGGIDSGPDNFDGDRSFQIFNQCPPGVICFGSGPVCVPAKGSKPDDNACTNSLPPTEGGCWITGIGFIIDADGHDNFGGNGMPMKDGSIRGEWEHVDHGTDDKFHGQVQYLVCRHVPEPGPGVPNGPQHDLTTNQAYYGGPGRWFTPDAGWADGYWFDVMAEDHGEPGNKAGPGQHGSGGPDFYHFTARLLASGTQSGAVVYDTAGDIVGGNFQIHPPNTGHPFTQGLLPPWVALQP